MIAPRRRKRDTFLPWVQLLVDVVSITALLYSVFWLRFASGIFESALASPDYAVYHRSFNVVTLVLVFFLRHYGLYRPARIFTFSDEAGKVFKAVAATVIFLMAVTFFIRGFTFSRTFLCLAGLWVAAGLALSRAGLGLFVMWVDKKRGSWRNILIVGCDANAKKLVHFYKKNPRFSMNIAGFLDDTLPAGSSCEGLPVLGRIQDLGAYIQFHREVHEVVLSAPRLANERVLEIITDCEKEMVTFRWAADLFGLIASKMSVSQLEGVSLLSFTDSPLSDWENRFLKRAMDIALSLAALLALSPLFLLIALWVKLDSRGPVFYKQQRIGEDGRRFPLYKFRTMLTDAEKTSGPVWAAPDDPRRTRMGEFLRKNNLDELPQLWNVLKGDMSLVGPRPERPFFVSRFREDIPRYMTRHAIRSGITGWAQVNGLRGNTSIQERTKFDLYYIENWSLLFDAKILFMTLFARRNAY